MTEVAVIEPWTVEVPPAGPTCEAGDCTATARVDMIWHDERRGQLHLQAICARCHLLLKDRGFAVFMPLDTAPPLEAVVAALHQEMYRRARAQRPGVYVRQNWGPAYGSYGGNGTGTGSNNIFFTTSW